MTHLLQRNEPNVTENRNIYVGGSDVPVILGLSKFKNQFELASEKVGITKSDFKGNEYTQYGHAMEPQIREYINLTTDYEFVETSTVCEERGLRSNTDGVDHAAKTLLEIKTHGMTPTIEIYKAQMQLYMFQSDLDQALLALYQRPQDFNLEFDSDNFDSFYVKRDDYFIEIMLHEIELFWKRCEWLEKNHGASEWDYNNCLPESIIPGGKRKMANELQVKTTKFEPAVIEFNYEEIEKQLDGNLKRYQGLTFTNKEAAECNRVVAELRKGKTLVDQYRIKTKKQLNEPVKAFEEQCKTLNVKFDSVINPLLEQSKEFDKEQREEKLKRVEEIKDQVIADLSITEEIADLITIEDRYLNKSTTLKSIEEDMHEQANDIITQKQNEQQNIDLIKAHVEIVNLRNELNLLDGSYLNLAAHKTIEEIREVIDKDSQVVLERRQQELEREEKELEAKRIAGAEKMKAQYEQEQKSKASEQAKAVVSEPVEEFLEVYEVIGTESQLDALEEFMKHEEIQFKIIEEE